MNERIPTKGGLRERRSNVPTGLSTSKIKEVRAGPAAQRGGKPPADNRVEADDTSVWDIMARVVFPGESWIPSTETVETVPVASSAETDEDTRVWDSMGRIVFPGESRIPYAGKGV